ncbi:MAG: hypothetical protein GEV28_26545 [Actinophytocola sp.]|uniref:hypothetical protein n=1 Tax=Actinophytocola sp. TaxID=1872138 RepID=UPI0013235695|nr:hypothetical protein [Actinophytocola sp.]MPZ83759.1 hypothetical protein [Actinophytocola sp.]
MPLRDRFERAPAEGDLPGGHEPESLARFGSTVGLGLAVPAAGGATCAELGDTVTATPRAIVRQCPPPGVCCLSGPGNRVMNFRRETPVS